MASDHCWHIFDELGYRCCHYDEFAGHRFHWEDAMPAKGEIWIGETHTSPLRSASGGPYL